MNFINKSRAQLIITVIVIISLFAIKSYQHALLAFWSLFVLLIAETLITSLFQFYRSRNGIKVNGIISEAKKNYPVENEDDFFYEYRVYFFWPSETDRNEIVYKSKETYKENKVTVWVNQNRIKKSIVVDQFDNRWKRRMIYIIVCMIVLIGIEVFLIKQSLNSGASE